VSTVTLLPVEVGLGLALGRGVGVAAGVGVAETAPRDDGVEGLAAWEAIDELQPATRTTMLSNTVTGRWFVPLIGRPPRDFSAVWLKRLDGLRRGVSHRRWRVGDSRT
jgi:hypothetical protein